MHPFPKSATRAIFLRTHFRSGIKKNCLSVFTGCKGLAGRKICQPISHRNCTRDSKLDLSMHCSHEGPPMMDPSTDLLPAQRLTAGDAQKLTFRILYASEEFSWKKLLYQNVYSLYQSSYLLFSTKNGPQNDHTLKNVIFDVESIFALGAFTGYPVLPGVSASLSDGEREYREKQIIIAMVTQSSSEHQLQTWLGV